MNNAVELPYEVSTLFPTPLYKTNIGRELTKQEQDEFDIIIEGNLDKDITYKSLKQSIDRYLLKRKPLLTIKSFFDHHLKQFANNIMGITDPNIFCTITQSWLNTSEPGQYINPHHHANSIISGVFYPKCLELPNNESDGIIFNRNETNSMFQFFEIPGKNPTQFAGSDYFCPLVTGDLVLFPSIMKHSVERNETSDQTRISLAFNTFFYGVLGNYENTSELILNR